MSTEAILAASYAAALIAGAFILEWLSAHTHRRALRYRTAGFTYHEDHDHWTCPEDQHLWPHEFDSDRRLVRYRAKAHVCNACPRKVACTDSDRGREVVRPLDPWPHSEAGRFHRGIALVMVGLGAGKFAGCARRSRASQRAARPAAASAPARSAASPARWWRAISAARISRANATSSSEMPRWKRPASECGHGSRGLTTSRPSFESVQRCFTGQALHTCARAR